MLLPVGTSIKFEGIPQFDRVSIPNLAALVGCLFVIGRPARLWTGFGFAAVPILMYLIGPFITAELNHDPISIGKLFLPAESQYDALSAIVSQVLLLLPFFLGRQVLRSSNDNEEILRVLVIAGLLYSVPVIFEARMSPQLHLWFYGYYSSDFLQSMRDNGFRPTVFMGHPLGVAFFYMTTTVAASALWRTHNRIFRLPAAAVTAYLGGILVLCKTLGAVVYGAVLVPLVRLTTPRTQLKVAVVLVTLALFYPVLRMADLVPTEAMLQAAGSVSSAREESLKTRFDNESALMERASTRLFFGWGRWGRNKIYSDTGKDLSYTDGLWIITIGQFGLFGFFAEFGLLVLPIFRAASALRFAQSTKDRVNLAALALIVAVNIVDLLPNSGLHSGDLAVCRRSTRQRRSAARAPARSWTYRSIFERTAFGNSNLSA